MQGIKENIPKLTLTLDYRIKEKKIREKLKGD